MDINFAKVYGDFYHPRQLLFELRWPITAKFKSQLTSKDLYGLGIVPILCFFVHWGGLVKGGN